MPAETSASSEPLGDPASVHEQSPPRAPVRQLGKGSGAGSSQGWLPRVSWEGHTAQNGSPVPIASPQRPCGAWGAGDVLGTNLLRVNTASQAQPLPLPLPLRALPGLCGKTVHTRGTSPVATPTGHQDRGCTVTGDSWPLLRSRARGQWVFSCGLLTSTGGGWSCQPRTALSPRSPGRAGWQRRVHRVESGTRCLLTHVCATHGGSPGGPEGPRGPRPRSAQHTARPRSLSPPPSPLTISVFLDHEHAGQSGDAGQVVSSQSPPRTWLVVCTAQ